MAKIIFYLTFIVLFSIVLSAPGEDPGIQKTLSSSDAPTTTGAKSSTDEQNAKCMAIQAQIAANEYKFALLLLKYFKGGVKNVSMSPSRIYRLLLVYMVASHNENRIYIEGAENATESQMKMVYNELAPSKVTAFDRFYTDEDKVGYAYVAKF